MIPPEVFLNEIAIIKDSNESEENMNLKKNNLIGNKAK